MVWQWADLFSHTLDCGNRCSFVVSDVSSGHSICCAADSYQTILPCGKDHVTCRRFRKVTEPSWGEKKTHNTQFVCTCCPRSPLAEYWMAVTAAWWGCSFISISEEASRKILKVPSLYPAATHELSRLEDGLQHTQPQAWHKINR